MTASSARALAAQEGELVDEVRGRVGRADPVVHPDLQVVAPLRRAVDADVKNVDPRLPPDQRLPDLLLDQATHGHRVGGEHKVVDTAPEVRPHLPLAGSGAEDKLDA